jgi:tripartite-type tricarboxylate transporter receptor subunit TctC
MREGAAPKGPGLDMLANPRKEFAAQIKGKIVNSGTVIRRRPSGQSRIQRHVMRSQRTQVLRLMGIVAALAVVPAALSSQNAWSQAIRTIKIVVPVPAGGGNDILARLLGEQISRTQGTTVVIENRPGAGSAIGSEVVSRAAPDGNTLLINAANMLIAPHLRKVNYDPLTSFEPICYLTAVPNLIVVSGGSPYRTLANLVNAAHVQPGNLTLAAVGPGSDAQIALELLKRAADVDITFIPYSGSAPAVNALLGEHVSSAIAAYASVAEHLKSGRLRALATTAEARIEALPDLPTVAESGYKDYGVDVWFGLFAPAKTPKAIVQQLADWFAAAIQTPEVKPKLVNQGIYPVGMCGVSFGTFLRKQFDDFGRIIREANIKAE